MCKLGVALDLSTLNSRIDAAVHLWKICEIFIERCEQQVDLPKIDATNAGLQLKYFPSACMPNLVMMTPVTNQTQVENVTICFDEFLMFELSALCNSPEMLNHVVDLIDTLILNIQKCLKIKRLKFTICMSCEKYAALFYATLSYQHQGPTPTLF